MERVPEPELMDDPVQVAAYARADFAVPHQAFVDDFRVYFPDAAPLAVIDLGCGSGDVTLRFARAFPQANIVALDAADAMLRAARQAADAAGLTQRISLLRAHLPVLPPALGTFDTILSNSVLHHLARPEDLWTCVRAVAAPGVRVWVRDLARPATREDAAALVERYAAGEPDILRRDFFNSLLASYRPAEIRAQLAAAGLGCLAVEPIGDRHVQVRGVIDQGLCAPGLRQ